MLNTKTNYKNATCRHKFLYDCCGSEINRRLLLTVGQSAFVLSPTRVLCFSVYTDTVPVLKGQSKVNDTSGSVDSKVGSVRAV